jgi:hypothetical protein
MTPDIMKEPLYSKFPIGDRTALNLNWFCCCCKEQKHFLESQKLQKPLLTFKEEFKEPDEAHIHEYGTKLKVKETGSLLLDPNVTHPFVRVHVIDMNTGMYLAKSDPHRKGVYNKESVATLKIEN